MPALPAQQARCSGVLDNVTKGTNKKSLRCHHRVLDIVEGTCLGDSRYFKGEGSAV